MNIEEKQKHIEHIINMLTILDVDGETMEYIIEKTGMTDQMLRQLIMNNPESETKDYLEEKMMFNEMCLKL